MTYSLLSKIGGLLRSLPVERNAARGKAEPAGRERKPIDEAAILDIEPKGASLNRVDQKAWDRLMRAAPRYAD